MQTTEEKVDTSKVLDASLVDTESSETKLKEQDTSSRSGNDAHADDADIKSIYDEEPLAEIATRTQTTKESVRFSALILSVRREAFRSMFEREKLAGSNFNDWFCQLRIVLRVEKKLNVLEQPMSPTAAPNAPKEELEAWNA
nr:hypothetical protein [Tanacetum cinerariifolium]